jgi:two-component system response regulator AtoC
VNLAERPELLVIEDHPEDGEIIADLLARHDLTPTLVESAEAALERLADHPFSAVISDVNLGIGMNGLELCARVRNSYPDTPVVVVSGSHDVETAVGAIRAGAYDFLTKPIAPDVMMIGVERALEHARLRHELRRLREETEGGKTVDGLLGGSPALRDVIELVKHVAEADATVLVTGESGTGKERISRAIHDLGPRREQPFVAINCAAVPPGLLESELFGHVKGAFTDAKRTRPGLFVQAGGGTVFLDEIGEMPIEMQPKLLRVLQERRVRPVGSDDEVQIHCRVVCATNRDLDAEVASGRFREDLYYRVNVVGVRVPPLRERGTDVLVLAEHFAAAIAARTGRPRFELSPEARRRLLEYSWPGNVRELENCVERAVAVCRGSEITERDLPDKVVAEHVPTGVSTGPGAGLLTLAEMRRRYVRSVLATVSGNKAKAARLLGIDRRSLYRRLENKGDDAAVPAAANTNGNGNGNGTARPANGNGNGNGNGATTGNGSNGHGHAIPRDDLGDLGDDDLS